MKEIECPMCHGAGKVPPVPTMWAKIRMKKGMERDGMEGRLVGCRPSDDFDEHNGRQFSDYLVEFEDGLIIEVRENAFDLL